MEILLLLMKYLLGFKKDIRKMIINKKKIRKRCMKQNCFYIIINIFNVCM